MLDTHCHLNLEPLSSSWQSYLAEAQNLSVNSLIIPGVDLATSISASKLASKSSALYAAVGFHPEQAPTNPNPGDLHPLFSNPKVVAIGECGLDYSREYDRNSQRTLFGEHIKLAKSKDLPLIIHCRDAYDDLLDTLRHFSTDDGILPRFVLHCMSGSLEYLKAALAMGAYISFAGNITYPKSDNLRLLLRATPLNRLLLETDAPFLAPQNHRGKPNTPALIKEMYIYAATILELDFALLEAQIETNARTFFRLP